MSLDISYNTLLPRGIYLRERLRYIKEKIMSFKKADILLTEADPEEMLMIEKIENGLKNEEFKMYLQFIVDSKDGKIVFAEALSRWESASGEIVPPIEYIGIMEKSGLIAELDYYMLEMACRKLGKWKNTEFDSIAISCNFARLTISEADFVEKVKRIADRYDFDRSKLVIEITESSAEKNLNIAINNILKVKEMGFRVALDDIGCGYTSFINLCKYPIDVMKMDRELLLQTEKERGKRLFFGIVSLAHCLGLEVVCEGVETEEQNTLVSESECDYIQGWYYSKALSEHMAESFFKEYAKKN